MLRGVAMQPGKPPYSPTTTGNAQPSEPALGPEPYGPPQSASAQRPGAQLLQNPYLLPNPHAQGPYAQQPQPPYAQGGYSQQPQTPYAQGPSAGLHYPQVPYAQGAYGPPPAGWSTKLRVWLMLFALAGCTVAIDAGRDVLRPKDAAPRKVTAAEAAQLPEGSWVEVTGTLDAEAAREVTGLLGGSKGVFAVQFAGEGPSPVLVTNQARTPAFGELTSKSSRFERKRRKQAAASEGEDAEADDPPLSPALVALFTEPQVFRGVLYKPGGQTMVKTDHTEIDNVSFKLGGYCDEPGIRCTKAHIVLVNGETPRPRILGIAQLLFGLAMGGVLAVLAIFGGRRRPTNR